MEQHLIVYKNGRGERQILYCANTDLWKEIKSLEKEGFSIVSVNILST